jgi:TIR domain/NACHT domain
MSSNQHGLNVTKPVSLLNRAIKFSFKDLFKSFTKAVVKGATGKYADALGDVVDALASVSLGEDCGEVAWLLIQRSLLQAVHDLLKENEAVLYRDPENQMVRLSRMGLPDDDPDAITSRLDLSLEEGEIVIDENFFRRPRTLNVLERFKTPFKQWLEMFGMNEAEANSIANRLPSYFVHALNEQWRARPEDYKCLKEAFDTPFTKAGASEQAWQTYAALLQKQVDEPMFVEAFSLRQVYVPLRAYFFERGATERDVRFDPRAAEAADSKRIVIQLEKEVDAWLNADDAKDAVRIISGGPGSGKSSFTKMLAARLAEANARRVLFVPLHLLELSDDLEDAVRKFIRYVDPALTNPLSPEENAEPLLVIFDGLDELAMQGRVAAELAQQFVREVREKIDRLNYRGSRLKVLISGRELAVQSNASDFKKPKQILHVLPYFVPEASRGEYTDAQNLLEQDQRQQWWKNYGKVSGYNYEGLPEELGRDELLEITSQPLLNYLVALSYTRGEVKLAEESNLNVIYRDLLKAVFESGWDGGRNPALQGVSEEKFVRWLEEIAVAAWHGDGRTTTVEEIKEHVESGGAASLLNLFEEGADKGITRLLMAFYFRRAGVRESGDKTFEFTHRSFGEYLTAKRIVRLLRDIDEELKRHQEDVDRGWDEREALVRWIKVCGPSALDEYFFKFVENEIRLSGISNALSWQKTLCKLIEFELRNGLPMELFGFHSFNQAVYEARNTDESLLVILDACARVTGKVSDIYWPSRTSFSELISRLRGQHTSANVIIFKHLDLLNLDSQLLDSYSLTSLRASPTINPPTPKAFISYSWDSAVHRIWVRDFATRLRGNGVDVTLDQWHAVPGDQLSDFMERAVRESDFVLIVCTPRYKEKSDNRQGGVGFEENIMTGEVLINQNHRKFIPILREGEWRDAAPSWLQNKFYVDLRGIEYSNENYKELLLTLLNERPQAPPLKYNREI